MNKINRNEEDLSARNESKIMTVRVTRNELSFSRQAPYVDTRGFNN